MQIIQASLILFNDCHGGGKRYPDLGNNTVLDWIERGTQLVVVLDCTKAEAQAVVDDMANAEFAGAGVDMADVDDFVWRATRARRDALIAAADWLVMRHMQETALVTAGSLTAATLTDAEYLELLAYIQELRRIPQGYDYPAAVVWPTPPDCVS
ncbi:MAG: Phage tail assembly chaperone protein [Desulfovibrionales bacterium]|nr:Phage tail assembly chaperone protein [Desulfovibrionales bacterium]